MIERSFPTDDRYEMSLSLGILQHGPFDPTTRVGEAVAWRALRTTDGPATLRFQRTGSGVACTAWGDGASVAIDGAAAMLGFDDDPLAYRPTHPLLRDLARRFSGVRMPKTGSILDSLLPSITEQKVTSQEAWRAYAAMVRAFGAPAPGVPNLFLPPEPAAVAAASYAVFHPFGLERRRADLIRGVCARAGRLEEAALMTPHDARARLEAFPGIGPWTSAEVTRASHGDPDVVSVGDFHLPNSVAWALAGEARGTDERMLDLLDGETGHRGRAVRYIELAGFQAPAFGPRHRRRSIARI